MTTTLRIVDAAEIPARSSRRSKTSPLRERILELTADRGLEVPYFHETLNPLGLKSSTVAQVAGRMTKESKKYRYSVRSSSEVPIVDDSGKPTGAVVPGCYIHCLAKTDA